MATQEDTTTTTAPAGAAVEAARRSDGGGDSGSSATERDSVMRAHDASSRRSVGPDHHAYRRRTADQVLLNDPLKHRFGAGMIPDTLGPDHGNRPGGADFQAIGLGAIDPAIVIQPQLAQAAFEEFP